jgi:hypothetical protein
MTEATRQILGDTMMRAWLCVYAGPGAPDYTILGTAEGAVADLCRRLGREARSHRLVQDDGVWTVRVTWADDGTVSTAFAAE